MTTLAADKPRKFALGSIQAFPVIASEIIYEGAAVGDNGSGIARPLVAGDPFLGFAKANADNSAGAESDINVLVQRVGSIELPITSLAITDKGKAVYASDDNAFTLTASTNTCLGYVEQYVSSGVGIVAFGPARTLEALLTDSSGGSATNTLAAISGTYVQAEIRDSIASLAAKVNHLLKIVGKAN